MQPFNWFSFPTPYTLHCSNYTTVSFYCLHPVDFVCIQKESSMVFRCSINCKCSFTMNRQDKPNLAISRTFRLRGWKLIWQHAFKRQPGATGHTRANMCFYVSLASVVFNYYVLGLFGQSFTLSYSLWLKEPTFNLPSTACFLVKYILLITVCKLLIIQKQRCLTVKITTASCHNSVYEDNLLICCHKTLIILLSIFTPTMYLLLCIAWFNLISCIHSCY